ncbi:hypothetical protein [Phreatobacter cathodiphilus]|nr:hypothetical protein [Phreatobacter cathodiphilus]
MTPKQLIVSSIVPFVLALVTSFPPFATGRPMACDTSGPVIVGNFRINTAHELATEIPHPNNPGAAVRPLFISREPAPDCTVRMAAIWLGQIYSSRTAKETRPRVHARAAAVGAATIVILRRGPNGLPFPTPPSDLPPSPLPSGDICIGHMIKAKPSYEREVGHAVVAACNRRCGADGHMRGCNIVYPLSDNVSLRIQFFADTDAEVDLERLDRAVRDVLSDFVQRVEN